MLEDLWRSWRHAAMWKGSAHHNAIGVASAPAHHCHPMNCHGDTMLRRITGRPRIVATMSRRRRSAKWAALASSALASPRTRTLAAYPAVRTASISCSGRVFAGTRTRADSVARSTLACTPGILLSLRSTRATHEAQVMPMMRKSMTSNGAESMGFIVSVPACSQPQ